MIPASYGSDACCVEVGLSVILLTDSTMLMTNFTLSLR